ncbi:hypothetical protein [Streptomyces barringtoniae]|uniref:hypothetical protein n=1 Tax=Streptomyces barringtoniae TaxID=2892029 RepID=UPI001E657B5A|nr:hypothetical protein [Streptomyces barringtoniae]MCC5480485.1 hypothetical protein [Streptomyces barringtoniae]
MRPDELREADRLRLLGKLLTKTELEITTATRLTEEGEIEDVLETMLGWMDRLGRDPGLAVNVLTNRLQRTAMQVSESEAEETPPGQEASFAAAMKRCTPSAPNSTPTEATWREPVELSAGRRKPSSTSSKACIPARRPRRRGHRGRRAGGLSAGQHNRCARGGSTPWLQQRLLLGSTKPTCAMWTSARRSLA